MNCFVVVNAFIDCCSYYIFSFGYVCRFSRNSGKPGFMSMAQDGSDSGSHRRKPGLLKDQVRLVKRKDSSRYEIAPIKAPLSFEKGFFVVIRACQLLAQNNEGIILVGLAGPSGAGKTIFTEKILNFMPSITVISMDNYNDASRIVDGNFDGNYLIPLFLE